MRIRYISYLSLGVAAAFLVVATYAFSLSTIAALSLGVGVVMLAVSLGTALRYRNDVPSLVVSGAIAAVSAWAIVSGQVFAQSTVDDLTFASALAVGALAAIGLTAHELDTERIVHKLEVHEGQGERAQKRERIAA
jgi:FtsH-binding integral membrane protein